jgi:dGTPase
VFKADPSQLAPSPRPEAAACPATGAWYAPADRERWVEERPKSASRTEFERDRARLVHSAALRRLGAKTQVRTPWRRGEFPAADDFIRTRLTHSLEVAQVGRELGKLLGCDPDVVDTACLAHDLGHPPFGHNGERALAEVTADIGGFEGNAQTLRLLTRLEAKVFDERTGRSVGLNLTRAALDAATKYPWARGSGPPGSDPTKFGVYRDEADVFAWFRAGLAPGRRCVEAQVMDFADDVAYSVHDVEDGVVGGAISLDALGEDEGRQRVCETARARFAPSLSAEDVDAAASRLTALPCWPREWDGSRRSLAGLKDMTSQLIGRFCNQAMEATRDRHGHSRLIRYTADLIVPSRTAAEIAVLKALATIFVMEPRVNDEVYIAQRAMIADLYRRLVETAPLGLEPEFCQDWLEADGEEARRRVIVDQIASLTDTSATLFHAEYVRRG